MEYSAILQNIGKHVTLDEAEANEFCRTLAPRTFRRKQVVHHAGRPCLIINFVLDGALRGYFCDDKLQEHIVMFALKDWWITDMYSFTTGQAAIMQIDALEDTKLLQLHVRDLNQLYDRIPKLEKFFRIIIQNAYIREQMRVIENLSMSAETRYSNFIGKYPLFAQRLPLKQIASYLGITPEFLSVLRSRARKNS